MKSGAFEQNDGWGIVERDDALVTLCSKSGREIYLGRVEPSTETVSEGLKLLRESIAKLATVTNDGQKVEVNLGPSMELKIAGRSRWVKSNVTVAMENPSDLEEMITATSDMATALLLLEAEKIKKGLSRKRRHKDSWIALCKPRWFNSVMRMDSLSKQDLFKMNRPSP